jgi:hypothetical protein
MRSALYASYTEALTGITSIRAYGEQVSHLIILLRVGFLLFARTVSSRLQTAGWTWRTAPIT